jgi:hypothetical protein
MRAIKNELPGWIQKTWKDRKKGEMEIEKERKRCTQGEKEG